MMLTYKDSWVKFEDCIEGMKELPDKSIDLCLTDPPYNVGFKGTCYGGKSYEDTLDKMEYIQWCKQWFEQISRISNTQLIFCGNPNIGHWCKYIEIPRDIAIWYKKNNQGIGAGYYLVKHDSILIYGSLKKKLYVSVIEQMTKCESMPSHPCPSNIDLYYRIIKELNPSTVLDPFMGSGTTLEACIQLSTPKHPIKCIGFELMEEYRVDMEKRIERCKYYKRPKTLDSFGLMSEKTTNDKNEVNI